MFTKNTNGFIEYNTKKEDLFEMENTFSKHFANNLSVNAKTVYNRPESRKAGILGELVFKKFTGLHGVLPERGDLVYDIIVNGAKVDVKCKFRNVVPQSNFEASFFTYQASSHFKENQYYVFMSTIKDFSKIWICGYLSKTGWLDNPNGRLWKVGEVDPTNGKKFDAETWSVMYKFLNKFDAKFVTLNT